MTVRPSRARALAALGVSLLVCGPGAARAQVTDTARTDAPAFVAPGSVVIDTVPQTAPDTALPLSPRAALIRSMILPGWGQAAFESYFRGGIYFAGWAANWYMMFRNQVRLNEARDRYDQRVATLRAALVAAGPDPDSIPLLLDQAIAADDGPGNSASSLDGLVASRRQQREDWIAWSIFWVLASGIDAFVNAHLADFPTGIQMEPGPGSSMSLGVRVPLPGPGP